MAGPEGTPSVGDNLHVVGHGPAKLVEVLEGPRQQYRVEFPDGSQRVSTREDIFVHEPSSHGGSLVGNPRGPRPLLYLGRAFSDPGRNIGVPSATFSLVATMMGGGVLSLPYAVSQSGLALGTIAVLLAGCASGWTMDLLAGCARSTGRDTYELVAHAACGEASRRLTVWIICINCWLSMVAYFVLMGDLLEPVCALVVPQLTKLGGSDTVRRLVVGTAALLLSPMCFKNDLASLRFLCVASVSSVLFVGFVVMLRSVENFGKAHLVSVVLQDGSSSSLLVPAQYLWWPADWLQALYVFPMFGVAFLCHFNALPTHSELQRPTPVRMRRVFLLTAGFASLLYLAMGVFGYLFAGRCTCGNILLNFRPSDKLVAVGRAALGLVLMLNFPLNLQPCRNALFRGLSSCRSAPAQPLEGDDWTLNTEAQHRDSGVSMQPLNGAQVHVYRREEMRSHSSLSRSIEVEPCDRFAPKDETVQRSAAQPTCLQRCVLTVVLLLSTLLVSFFMESILVVWSILGSTVAFLVAFILPALYWYRIVGPVSKSWKRLGASVLLVLSTVMAVACTVLTCMHLHAPRCPVTSATDLLE